MDGGIDLAQLGFTGCISTFLPHTRSSQSFTAVLKDFEIIPYNSFFSSRRRHTRFDCDWSSDVCSSDLIEGAAHFLAARVRHDAETAVLAAALHDGHEGPRAFGPRRRQAIEFFDLREAHIHDRSEERRCRERV